MAETSERLRKGSVLTLPERHHDKHLSSFVHGTLVYPGERVELLEDPVDERDIGNTVLVDIRNGQCRLRIRTRQLWDFENATNAV